MRTNLVVGICGGSGAGKHRVIHHHLLPALRVEALVIEHDWYYHEWPHLVQVQGVKGRLEVNYDQPEAYENERLIEDLRRLRRGESIHLHAYQKATGMRHPEALTIEPREVVIVDGMMILAVPELVEALDIRAFVHADPSIRLRRRIDRDLSFCPADESIERYERDVAPAHVRYVEPSRARAQFQVDNSRDGMAPEGVQPLVEAVLDARHGPRNPRS